MSFTMKELIKELNVGSLVRSGVIVILGAPVVLAVADNFSTSADAQRVAGSPDARVEVIDAARAEAAPACIKWLVSKDDSKLEREAKNELDEVFGGEVNHEAVCKWVFG